MAATSHLQATKEPRQAGLGTGGREGHQQARGFGDEEGKGVLNLSSIGRERILDGKIDHLICDQTKNNFIF